MKAMCAAGLLALASLAACSEGPGRPPDVLLIVVDTLRADRLGAYGNRRGLTPTLDALADRASVFHNTIATSPWTSPSIASLFTARYPSQHGVISSESVLAPEEYTLAEALRAQGYRTAGLSASSLGARRQGFTQGFDFFRRFALRKKQPRHHFVAWQKARAELINRAALAWLDEYARGDAPVFLFLHYMEPHTPFSPPSAILSRLIGDRTPPDLDAVTDAQLLGREIGVSPETLRDIQDVYDAEVASLDVALGQLFIEFEKRGLFDRALVVFTSDHGEEFTDHGMTGHGHTLYQELIRVPLLIRTPGQDARVDVDHAVSLVDVAPTILRWAGAAIPPQFAGRDLTADPRPTFSELLRPADFDRFSPHERSIVLGDRKLILGTGGESEVYNLTTDPGEQSPADGNSPDVAALWSSLSRFAERSGESETPRRTAPPDAEMLEQLRGLGYIE